MTKKKVGEREGGVGGGKKEEGEGERKEGRKKRRLKGTTQGENIHHPCQRTEFLVLCSEHVCSDFES